LVFVACGLFGKTTLLLFRHSKINYLSIKKVTIMPVEETVIYELMTCVNQLKEEIKNLKEELKEHKKALNENTFELLKSN
jgi:hypothetical protein